jgi:hypothetical protein
MPLTIQVRKNQFPHVLCFWTIITAILIWTLANIKTIGMPLFGTVSYIINPIGLAYASYKTVMSFYNYWYIIFDKKSRLVIDDEGVSDFLTIHSFGTFSWDEVLSFEIKTFVGVKVLLIDLKDPVAFIKRQSRWKQKQARRNFQDFGTPALISEKHVDCDITELMFELRFRQDKVLCTTEASQNGS